MRVTFTATRSIPRDAVVDSVVARGPGREGHETRLEGKGCGRGGWQGREGRPTLARGEAGGREEGEEEEEEESAMDYHRSKGSLPGGKVVARRDARGCRCTAEPPVDATARKPLQRSTLAFASPLLLALSLSRISLSLSFFIPLCTLLFSSSCSFLASLPAFGCFSLSRSLPLSPPPCPHSSCYPSILTAPSVNDLRAR